MTRALALYVLVACGGAPSTTSTPVGSAAPAPTSPPPSPPAGIPAEVTKLVERWEICWHFAGEEPYDAERAKQIQDGVAKSCPGNEEERARLEAKYAGRADVMRELAKLDDMQ